MKRLLKIVLMVSFLVELVACSPKQPLIGVWQSDEGSRILEITENEIITQEILLGLSVGRYPYELKENNTILLYILGGTYLIPFTIENDKLTISVLSSTTTFTRVPNATTVNWNVDKENNNSNAPFNSGSYLCKTEVDRIANNEFSQFISDYLSNYGEHVVAYLPEYLDCIESSNQYTYTFVFFGQWSPRADADARGVDFTVTTLPNKEYKLEIEEPYSAWIGLTNANDREMNIRDYPDTTGEIKGSVDVRETIKIYGMNWSAHEMGSPYIWYSLNDEGSRWVADGIDASKDYYYFGNGCSTKDMIFDFRWVFDSGV